MPRLEDDYLAEDDYLEWYIEDKFVRELQDAGWFTVKGDHIKRGYPDQFCFGPNAQVAIVEFKRKGAKKKRAGEKLQKHYMDQLKNMKHKTYRVTGEKQANELRDKLLAKRPAVRRN